VWLVTGFSLWRPESNPRATNMEFVVDTMALPQVSPEAPRFSFIIIIPLLLHIHLSSGADTVGSFIGTVLSDSVSPHPMNKIINTYYRHIQGS